VREREREREREGGSEGERDATREEQRERTRDCLVLAQETEQDSKSGIEALSLSFFFGFSTPGSLSNV